MLRTIRHRGFSMIELLVVITIIGTLTAIGVPELGRYAENQRIKTAASNFNGSLQTARVESIRRNLPVQLIMTSSEPVEARVTDAVATRTGPNWIVRARNPDGTFTFIEGFSLASLSGRPGSNGVTVNGTRGGGLNTVEFQPTARVFFNPTESPPYTADPGIFAFENPIGGTCAIVGVSNPMRCLQVRVARSGQTRICDPATDVATDPRRC